MAHVDIEARRAYAREWAARRRASDPVYVEDCRRRNREYMKRRLSEDPVFAAAHRVRERLRYHEGHNSVHAQRRRSEWYRSINGRFKSMLRSAALRARKKGLPFDLTIEWAKSKWTGRCEVSGLEFNLRPKGFGPQALSPSIDRIENQKGYTQDNCRFILLSINSFKGSAPEELMWMIHAAMDRGKKDLMNGCSNSSSDRGGRDSIRS